MKILHQMYNKNQPNYWYGSAHMSFAFWSANYTKDSTVIFEVKE